MQHRLRCNGLKDNMFRRFYFFIPIEVACSLRVYGPTLLSNKETYVIDTILRIELFIM